MFSELYIMLMAGAIPFFSWQQREEGRNFAGMIITGLFMVLWLITDTAPLVFDQTTIYAICFSLWMIASMLWTHSRQSGQDLFTLLSCIILFLAARKLPLEFVLASVFIPGVIFSLASLYWWRPTNHPVKRWPIFGNSNHVGAFLLCPLFIGLWFSVNSSPLFIPFTAAIAIAIMISQCRGAQVGAVSGLLYVAVMQYPYISIGIPIVLALAWGANRHRMKGIKKTIIDRMALFIAATFIIRKSPLAGFGLRTFRREYPNVMPELLADRFAKIFFHPGANGEIHIHSSHRVHNDHLELMVELGIIGYILFIAIFFSFWPVNSLLAGALVAFAVHGLFFFPLREAHTAFPFFAFSGACAGATAAIMPIHPLVSIVLALIVGKLVYEVVKKTIGLFFYDKAAKIVIVPNPEDAAGRAALKARQMFLATAINKDPYNNIYLTEGYYYNVFENPEQAFQYASRCMENYDGGKVRWGVCDQYARALLRLGGFGVAKLALDHSLRVAPGNSQSMELMNQVLQMESQAMAQGG